MTDDSSRKDQACAAVVAGDEALRASLVLLLDMCGVETAGFAEPEELLGNSRLDERFIFLDYPISEGSGVAELQELRRRGWSGTAILMTEGEPPLDWALPERPLFILVKPFSCDDVLAILWASRRLLAPLEQ